jgi:hypothetical protein
MSLIWFVFGLAVGAVFGAKHQEITLFLYNNVKPYIDSVKVKVKGWFARSNNK